MTLAPARVDPDLRLGWVDAARGASVTAVVLFHVTLWWHLPGSGDPGPWGAVNGWLDSVRMPLLLAVSGMVASRGVLAGLGDTRTRVRAAANVYLYVVWLAVYTVLYAALPAGVPHRVDGPLDALTDLAVPETPLWYLYALPIYTLGLAAVRRVPVPVVLGVLAVASVAARTLLDEAPGMTQRVVVLGVFFAIGVHAAPALRRFAAHVTPGRAVGWVAGSALVKAAERTSDVELYRSVLYLARGLVSLVAAVALVALVARWAPARRALATVGRRTLPVYVLHVPLLGALIALVPATGGVVAPVVVTAVVVAICLGLHRVLARAGGGVLFGMPVPLRRAAARGVRRRTSPAR